MGRGRKRHAEDELQRAEEETKRGRLSAKQALKLASRQSAHAERHNEESDDEENGAGASGAASKVAAAAAAIRAASAVMGGKKVVYRNKKKTLVLSNRAITTRFRHMQSDLVSLMPHAKKDAKLDSKDEVRAVTELCELRGCNGAVFFEVRKHQDLYLWVARTPSGPSVKFHVANVHTMEELKMIGNCLKGSRSLLHFDAPFDAEDQPHLRLMKELFTHVFSVPLGHPKSKPFIDHMLSFFYVDNRVWFRNYQLVEDTSGKRTTGVELVEIGPRFVMTPIRVLAGSFSGTVLWDNPNFVSPNVSRAQERKAEQAKFVNKMKAKKRSQINDLLKTLPGDVADDVYLNLPMDED